MPQFRSTQALKVPLTSFQVGHSGLQALSYPHHHDADDAVAVTPALAVTMNSALAIQPTTIPITTECRTHDRHERLLLWHLVHVCLSLSLSLSHARTHCSDCSRYGHRHLPAPFPIMQGQPVVNIVHGKCSSKTCSLSAEKAI